MLVKTNFSVENRYLTISSNLKLRKKTAWNEFKLELKSLEIEYINH